MILVKSLEGNLEICLGGGGGKGCGRKARRQPRPASPLGF